MPLDELLRQGEVLVLEWDNEYMSKVFGDVSERFRPTETDDAYHTFDDVEELLDPVIVAQREADAAAAGMKKDIGLSQCIQEFTNEEQLGEEDLWYCPQCKEHRQATKKLDLWKMPEVLVLHLKRFSATRNLRDKLDAFIDFPVTGLDMTEWVISKDISKDPDLVDQGLIYDLFAVDNHYGGLGGGHYTAYARNFETGQWYNFDDSIVSPIQVDSVRTSAAYLLFYRRRRRFEVANQAHNPYSSIPRYLVPHEESSMSATSSPMSVNTSSDEDYPPSYQTANSSGLEDDIHQLGVGMSSSFGQGASSPNEAEYGSDNERESFDDLFRPNKADQADPLKGLFGPLAPSSTYDTVD